MSFTDQVTTMRRFLRDPEGLIWSIDDLRTYWNDAQVEIAQKIGYLQRAHAYRYPPSFTYSHLHAFEFGFAEGDRRQAGLVWEQGGMSVTAVWESLYWEAQASPFEEGYRTIHPFESCMYTAGDPVEIPLHERYESIQFAAFDAETITPRPEKQIALRDGWYRLTPGRPLYYYHPDEVGNRICLYPKPSATFVPDDVEEDASIGFDDAGGIRTWREDSLSETDIGLTIEQIDTTGQLFVIFDSLPDPVEEDRDPIPWWPPWMLYVVRAGTLERAFGANTDGCIPSLRDYWKMRKETAIKAIKAFRIHRESDRDRRLGTPRRRPAGSTLRLPDTYPAV